MGERLVPLALVTHMAPMTSVSYRAAGVLLTPAEVAARLRVSVRTAQRLITTDDHLADKRIRGVRVGRQLRVDEADLDRYLTHRDDRGVQLRLPVR